MTKSLPKPGSGPESEEAFVLDTEFQDITDLEGDFDDVLSSITSEFDADEHDVVFLIKVYRIEEKTGKSRWLFNCQPEELPIMERLRDSYGTGIYQVRVYKNKKLYRRFSYPIEAPKISEVKSVDVKNEMAGVFQAFMQAQQLQFNQLKELMLATSKPAPAFDPLAMMTGFAALMVQVKNLMPQPAPAGNQIDTLLKGMELMRDFSGDKGESSLIDVFRDLIKSPIMEKALEGIANQTTSQPAINPALLNPPASAVPIPDGANQMNPIVKGYLNQLVKKAAQNSDPELYAAFILDNVPEKMVREYLLREDLMQMIIAINPAAAEYGDWFAELKNNITEMLTEDGAENLTPPGESADTATDASKPDTSEHPDEPATGEGGN